MENPLPVIPVSDLLAEAFRRREALFNDPETNAYRMFNGFTEGCPLFTVDRYNRTAVIQWMSGRVEPALHFSAPLIEYCRQHIPGVEQVLWKDRYRKNRTDGEKPWKAVESIREWNVPYCVDLMLNKDCGFYLDSALLRKWLLQHAAGLRVLNTFAYTGSLGDAAAAGGALSVTQTDINRNYLRTRHSEQEYLFGDFFHVAASLRRSDRLFDLILLDPPFFASAGRSAKVDQERNTVSLINKVRPLAAHHGKIVAVNNALFLSGRDYLKQLDSICGDCLSIGDIIPVPESFYGYSPISPNTLPADPAPFNHPTKIVILDVVRKDRRQ